MPWRWDHEVRVAVAPGLSCYVAGRVYEHGGLSPQECVTPVLTVRRPGSADCRVHRRGDVGRECAFACASTARRDGATVDVRTKAASAAASKLDGAVTITDGAASALVADPDAMGEAAFVVVLGPDGSLLAQRSTTIGGDA